MAANEIRLMAVDDHPIIISGLRGLLANVNDISLVAEANSGAEAMSVIGKMNIDILLLDLDLPDTDGFQLLRTVHTQYPDIKVIMLSVYSENHFGLSAIKAGAFGYLMKSSPPEQILHAIRVVYSGKKYSSTEFTDYLLDRVANLTDEIPHERLTERQLQIFRLIAIGRTVSEIADMLGRSVKTINATRDIIKQKMNLKNNAEITQYAIRHKLI